MAPAPEALIRECIVKCLQCEALSLSLSFSLCLSLSLSHTHSLTQSVILSLVPRGIKHAFSFCRCARPSPPRPPRPRPTSKARRAPWPHAEPRFANKYINILVNV